MKSRFEKGYSVISDINIVPFVDIVLVILIIFLLISPTFIRPGFKINLPKAQTAKIPENVKIILSIDIQGQVYFNGKLNTEVEINEKLKAQVKKDPNVKAIIAADKNVAHGNVITLFDLVRKAGVKNFAVSVESDN